MYKSTLFTLTTLFAFNTYADQTTPHEAPADIKPALSISDDLDEEQEEELRLAKIIHERILKQQKLKNKKGFTPYSAKTDLNLDIEMVPIKGGSFMWNGEQETDKLEVTLSPFWIGAKEITWDQYEVFRSPEPARQRNGQLPDFIRDSSENEIDFIARPTPQYYPLDAGMPHDGYPMLSMTQHAANKYCQWLSMKTGHFYRLPTEAEWEYACRAGSTTKYSWGDDPADGANYAWFGGDDKSHYKKPGQKKPNAWGLYDMHGNMMEWTLDQHVPNRQAYFAKKKVTNPWIKATNPYPHVTKGGNWKHSIDKLAADKSLPSHPKWKVLDPQGPKSIWYHTSAQIVGFRIVRPVKIPTAEEMYHYWNSGVAYDGNTSVYEKK